MAVVFSKIGNESLYKPVQGVLTEIISDAEGKQINDDEVLNALFINKKSKKFAEGKSGLTEFSGFRVIGEGQSAVADEVQEGFSKIIQHTTFAKSFTVTREMIEDGRIDDAKLSAENFVRSYKRSKLDFATAALVSSGITFTYDGKQFDRTTGDGKALFAVDHPGKKNGVAVQSNVFTNALGTDVRVINTLANYMRNFKNDSGNLTGYTANVLIIPGNRPDMEETANRIIYTSLVVGSGNNDINTQKGKWRLVVNHRWEAAAGTNPFIIMSEEANQDYSGSVFFNRTPLSVSSETDIQTANMIWVGRARMSCGFYNWRHLIMGGAAAGTTISFA